MDNDLCKICKKYKSNEMCKKRCNHTQIINLIEEYKKIDIFKDDIYINFIFEYFESYIKDIEKQFNNIDDQLKDHKITIKLYIKNLIEIREQLLIKDYLLQILTNYILERSHTKESFEYINIKKEYDIKLFNEMCKYYKKMRRKLMFY